MINEENKRISERGELFYLKVHNLLFATSALGEILESYVEKKRNNNDRPFRHVYMVWEDAVDIITQVQLSAKYFVEEANLFLLELEICDKREKDTARTLEQYANEADAARNDSKKWRHREGVWADICQQMWEVCANRMSQDEKDKLSEFKAKMLKKLDN